MKPYWVKFSIDVNDDNGHDITILGFNVTSYANALEEAKKQVTSGNVAAFGFHKDIKIVKSEIEAWLQGEGVPQKEVLGIIRDIGRCIAEMF